MELKFVVLVVCCWAKYVTHAQLTSEEAAILTESCCAQGENFGVTSTNREECSTMPLEDVEEDEVEPCLVAAKACCLKHYLQKDQCSDGMKYSPAKRCTVPKTDIGKACCDECSFGRWSGESQGKEACGDPSDEEFVSPTTALRKKAFRECCLKAAAQTTTTTTTTTTLRTTTTSTTTSTTTPSTTTEKKIETTTKKRESCKEKNPCSQVCSDDDGVVKCQCNPGYRLQGDGKSCKDINECAEYLEDLCTEENTVCHNIPGSFKCVPLRTGRDISHTCPPGFKRNVLNQVCDDINECQLPRPPCPKYLCENTIGGYKCSGRAGKPSAEPSPEAPPEPSKPAKSNMCPQGFRDGPHNDCVDIDECEERLDDCQRLSQYCINSHGSFFCQDHVSRRCAPGFKANALGVCEDINECENSQEACRKNEVCVNLPGAYDCKSKISSLPKLAVERCQEGTKMRSGSCEDVDECREGTHLCDLVTQNCFNKYAGFECNCKDGFELDSSSNACVDIDECPQSPCGAGLHCINRPGSYSCARRPLPLAASPPTPAASTTHAPDEYEYYYSDEDEDGRDPRPTPTTTSTARAVLTQPATPKRPVPNPDTLPDRRPNEFVSEENPEENEQEWTRPKPVPAGPQITSTTTTTAAPVSPRQMFPRPPPLPPLPPRPSYPAQRPAPNPARPTQAPNRPNPPPRPNYPSRPSTTPVPTTPKETYPMPPPPPPLPPRPNPAPSYPAAKPARANPAPTRPTYPTREEMFPKPVRPSAVIPAPENKTDAETEFKYNVDDLHCLDGYKKNDKGECIDVDECATGTNTCNGLEVCTNTPGRFTCDCAAGYERDPTGWCVSIRFLRPESSSTTTTSTERTTAASEPDRTYQPPTPSRWPPKTPPLFCELGYQFDDSQGRCIDIDECATRKASCRADEQCVNTEGGYQCRPDTSNYVAPTIPSVPSVRGSNAIMVGSQYGQRGPKYRRPSYYRHPDQSVVSINCPWGYKLTGDKQCLDVDECALGVAECGPRQTCENFHGGYQCQCPSGHQIVGVKDCEDIDECAYGNSCSTNAQCVNTVGSYHCACAEGFRTAPSNDKMCVDIDECYERPGLCQQSCVNAWGGYRCTCNRGYQLAADNSTCVDVDECAVVAARRGRICVGECVNTDGSYRCGCPDGYRIGLDGKSCIDIDECESGEATCANGADPNTVCQNTRGSYHCHAIDCPSGYRLESKHICRKIQQYCQVNDISCLQQPSSYSYHFITFVSNIFIMSGASVSLFSVHGPASLADSVMNFELQMLSVEAPPHVRPADISCFDMKPSATKCAIALTCSLEGPQVAELELTTSVYQHGRFYGTNAARVIVIVSQYEY